MSHKIEVEFNDSDWDVLCSISAIVGLPVSKLVADLFIDSSNIHRFVIQFLGSENICNEINRNEKNFKPHSILVKYLQEYSK